MTTGMLQDTIQTLPSGSGPRFRPYACPNHHVTKGRYITSNDSRGYIPVYEYPLNGQWIMMDIDDGYILWTGIWKALGNSKADIVKMIDSQPDLAPLIRRVRGGYLKIQGTWMPYEVALKLSRRVAWTIRDDLIPLFGPTFPSTCLSPDQPGYGQVVPTGQNKRRPRRATRNSIMEMPRAPGWTVVTPSVNMVAPCATTPFHPSASSVRSSDYRMASPYPVHSQIRGSTPSDIRLSPISSSVNGKCGSSQDAHRYGGYNSYPLSSYRNPGGPTSPSSKAGLSLDIGNSESRLKEEISLPPIHTPDSNSSSPSPYSLPPISSMEEVRGSAPQDSAAVLRRLRMDDDGYNKADHFSQEHTWDRRHSLSIHSSSPRSIEPSSRFQPYNSSRSFQEHSAINMGHPSGPNHSSYQRLQKNSDPGHVTTAIRSDASQYSHENDSTSNPSPTSPTSPTTPNSALSEYGNQHHLYMKGNANNNHHNHNHNHHNHNHHHYHQGKLLSEYTDRINHQWSTPHPDRHGRIVERPESISVRRNSFSDRPW